MRTNECVKHRQLLWQANPFNLTQVSFGGLVGVVFALFILYYLLLGTSGHFFSLNLMIDKMPTLPSAEQLVAIILMPVYLALIIFGSGILGAWIGAYVQSCIKLGQIPFCFLIKWFSL